MFNGRFHYILLCVNYNIYFMRHLYFITSLYCVAVVYYKYLIRRYVNYLLFTFFKLASVKNMDMHNQSDGEIIRVKGVIELENDLFLPETILLITNICILHTKNVLKHACIYLFKISNEKENSFQKKFILYLHLLVLFFN